MSHITQTIKARYDIEKIKELIIADMLNHGVRDIGPDDIKDGRVSVSDGSVHTVYVHFEAFEVRKEQPITKNPPLPIKR